MGHTHTYIHTYIHTFISSASSRWYRQHTTSCGSRAWVLSSPLCYWFFSSGLRGKIDDQGSKGKLSVFLWERSSSFMRGRCQSDWWSVAHLQVEQARDSPVPPSTASLFVYLK